MSSKQQGLIFLLLFIPTFFFSQSAYKSYFDRAGKTVGQNQAYYYREQAEGDKYKAYYVSNGALYYEGRIIRTDDRDDNLSVFTETCNWYYKNGKKKAVRTFDAEGKETGTSTYYYESGKLWKEIEFAKGKIVNNRYNEYNEDGQSSRIFEENFNDNSNDWDLYKSDKNSVDIKNGVMEIISFTKEGASRYISLSSDAPDFALEAVIDIKKLKDGDKAGIIYGFKDWQNYNYFFITNSSMYIGSVYEGVGASKSDGMYASSITKDSPNNIKIISSGDKAIYSINGEIQYSTDRLRNFGSNIGFGLSGKSTITIDKLVYKEIDFKSAGVTSSNTDMDVKASGSGLIFSTNGYVLTNYHVVEGSNKILIEMNSGGTVKTYNATVVNKDIDNDLAIVKINDESFKKLDALPYSFKESGGMDVGSAVFTIGYPYALSGMGKEAKFTDGKISSKTGYNGAINAYQTSIPVQPGNSGGPLFNDKGQLVGVINSKITEADNVSYAIKLNYVKNLIEVLPETVELPSSQSMISATLEEKIKSLTNYVVLIKIK